MSLYIYDSNGNKVLDGETDKFKSFSVGLLSNVCAGNSFTVYGRNEKELREEFEKLIEQRFTPKLNKLQQELYGDRHFGKEMIKDIVENKRGCGKTTAHAMKQIAEAIQNPGKAINLHNDEINTVPANRIYINDVVRPMIEKLGLKFMVIRQVEQTLTFEV